MGQENLFKVVVCKVCKVKIPTKKFSSYLTVERIGCQIRDNATVRQEKNSFVSWEREIVQREMMTCTQIVPAVCTCVVDYIVDNLSWDDAFDGLRAQYTTFDQ